MTPTDPLVPEHMDRWSRNQRLYETLKGMGLFVIPIPEVSDPSRINHLLVSADKPAENSAESGVVAMVQGAKISDPVGPPERARGNVINFPPVL